MVISNYHIFNHLLSNSINNHHFYMIFSTVVMVLTALLLAMLALTPGSALTTKECVDECLSWGEDESWCESQCDNAAWL